MNERLDLLLSTDIDDELDPAEREELERLLSAYPEAGARRAQLESVDERIRQLAPVPQVERGFERLQARIAEGARAGTATSTLRSRAISRWVAGAALAAAAAAGGVFVVQESRSPEASPATLSASSPANPSTLRSDVDGRALGVEQPRLVDDPIALALVFELDEEAEAVRFVDSIPPEDLEIIEQLPLLEYLAARETEGRG